MNKQLIDLMEFVKGKAPDVWHAVYIQQYIYAVIITTITVGLGIAFKMLCSKFVKRNKDDRILMGMVVVGIFFIVFVLIFFIQALPRLINPAYYAISYFWPWK